jgi:hypothetical protein
VFHYLNNIVLTDDFMDVFQLIVDLSQNTKSLLNQVNKEGFSAVHHLIKAIAAKYSQSETTFSDEFREELVASKKETINTSMMAVKKTARSKSRKRPAKMAKKRASKSRKWAGLKGGARTKMTARKSWGGKAPMKSGNYSSWNQNSNNMGNNFGLTLEEENDIKTKTQAKLADKRHETLDVFEMLLKSGADFQLLTQEPVKNTEEEEEDTPVQQFGFAINAYSKSAARKRISNKKKEKNAIPVHVGSNLIHLISSHVPDCLEWYKFLIEEGNISLNTQRQDKRTELAHYMK